MAEKLQLPGFVDAHSHGFQRALRGRNEGEDFWAWRESMLELARAQTPERVRKDYVWIYRELRDAGYTAVGEFHYLGLAEAHAAAGAAAEAGVELVLLYSAYARGGIERFRQASVGEYLRGLEELRDAGIRVGLAPHSVRACPRDWLERLGAYAEENELPLQPRIVLAPNGKFFYAAVGQMWGPFGQSPDEATTALYQFYDPKTKTWSVSGLAPLGARSGAFVAPLTMEPPYDQMTIVTFGGVLGPTPGSWLPANPFTTLTTIDANGNVNNRMSGNLNHARWYASGVLLPDGQVLAVGGDDKDDAFDPGMGIAVKIPELFNPSTGTWTDVAGHTRARGYHNSALLLPDMRVLLGGNAPIAAHYGGANQDQGGPFTNNDNDPSFEIWSPPYLFRGPRPSVTRVQRAVGYGDSFAITTPDAGLIESVLLMRTPSPEHINDSDQRALRLEFTRSGSNTLTATAPPSGNVAPPGTYYLVVNKKSLQGPIPSVAHMVDVGHRDVADALQPFADDAPAPVNGSATPDEDTSRAAAAQQTAHETAQQAAKGLPAPVGGPVSAMLNRRWLFLPR